jgi:hypothetical protein
MKFKTYYGVCKRKNHSITMHHAIYDHGYTGGGQNNGSTKKLRNRISLLATLKDLQLATLNVLPFVYTL